jgi:peptidyl-prolyl cis-trans isomerase SurA
MKIRSIFSVTLFILSFSGSFAQNPDEKILMTVAGRGVEAGEFIRMYNKSLDPAYKTDLNDYLEQFIAFKLKVADAIDKGYDTTASFKEELNGYRNQLAQSYLTDPDIKEKLLRKAYQRSLSEVNASHILVNCTPDAMPEDTLKAYKKAIDIRERIIRGESFEQVAKATSDDKSVLINNGNLGYFTVFQMITPFEEAAFTLKPGILSMPVRTPYGYHIIKVSDRRPSKGKVRVAHIMKAAPPGSNDQTIRKAETEINGIYEKLRKGDSFSKLASELSDHKESAANGGEMSWFGAGEIISDFSEAALSIKDTGDYTKPVRSVYGFHIIRLLEKKAPGSWEESKSFLESRLNQSNLVSLGKKSFIDRLRKEYKYRINPIVRNWFVDNTDTLIIRGVSKYNRRNIPQGNIYTFANQHLSGRDFASSLEKRGNMIITNNPDFFIDSSVESIASEEILKYENSVLEQKYPDFKYLMNEFHDGILLFEISSEKVWNKVQEDSAGLQKYYDANKNNFMSEKSIEARMYSLRESDGAKRLAKAYRKYSRKPDTDKRLMAKFNFMGDTLLTIKEGKWTAGVDPDIDKLDWTKGLHSFTKEGFPSLINITKINEPAPRPLTEVQADMISDYQAWLTEEWIKQLKEKYTVKIDNQIFDEVKKRLGNE